MYHLNVLLLAFARIISLMIAKHLSLILYPTYILFAVMLFIIGQPCIIKRTLDSKVHYYQIDVSALHFLNAREIPTLRFLDIVTFRS